MKGELKEAGGRRFSLFFFLQEYALGRVVLILMVFLLVTGAYYFFLGSGNWNVAQVALGGHLAAGVLLIPAFFAYLRRHLSWGLRISSRNRSFRCVAWTFLLLFVLVLLSGILNAVPFLLYLINIIWFPSFQTFDLVATVHLYGGLTLPLLLLGHLRQTLPFGYGKPSDIVSYLKRTEFDPKKSAP